MADDDAAGRQQLLDQAQPEREAEVEPDGVADDLGREPVAGVAGTGGGTGAGSATVGIGAPFSAMRSMSIVAIARICSRASARVVPQVAAP